MARFVKRRPIRNIDYIAPLWALHMPYGLLEQNIFPRRRHRLDQCLTCEEQSVRVLSLACQMQIAVPPLRHFDQHPPLRRKRPHQRHQRAMQRFGGQMLDRVRGHDRIKCAHRQIRDIRVNLGAQMREVFVAQLAFSAGWRAGRMPKTGRRAARYRLRKLIAGRVCAPELMVRVDPVRAAGVQFDTRFGVGAQHPVGEDYIFVCDMLGARLRGAAFPILTGAHSGLSMGDNWTDTGILNARRTVLHRCFGS